MKKILIVLHIFALLMVFETAKGETIADGDLIKTADSFDIYIVKLKNDKKFKRLILNPEIFNSYGHLKWENVKTVSQATVSEYTLSEFVIQVNPDGSVADPKVYKVSSVPNSDTGERRWLNITAAEFNTLGYDWDSLYQINNTEASPDFYPTKDPLTYELLSAPESAPTPTPAPTAEPIQTISAPEVTEIAPTKILADSAVITWNTNKEADTVVKYGTSENALNLSTNGASSVGMNNSFTHTAALSGLAENTKYYFQAISTDSSGNAAQIVTNSFTTTDCYGDVPSVHATIQQAIDAVTKDGGKICVAAGTFQGRIVIADKNVKIIGQGHESTIISNASTSAVISFKNTKSSSIEKIKIQSGENYAITIEDSSPIIKNNHIVNNFAGIKIIGSSRPDISYNVFANNTGGPAVAQNGDVGSFAIDHNTFTNNGVNGLAATILLDGPFPSSPINITNNILINGYVGVHEKIPSNFYLWNNVIYNNDSVNLQRQNSYYYGEKAINDLGVATKNIVADPLLDTAYKLKTNSPALSAGTQETNIGAN